LFDSQFEFAVRSWALQSPEILSEVQKADQLRMEALTRMFVRFGLDELACRFGAQAASDCPSIQSLH
jgi:hypothetical protein